MLINGISFPFIVSVLVKLLFSHAPLIPPFAFPPPELPDAILLAIAAYVEPEPPLTGSFTAADISPVTLAFYIKLLASVKDLCFSSFFIYSLFN